MSLDFSKLTLSVGVLAVSFIGLVQQSGAATARVPEPELIQQVVVQDQDLFTGSGRREILAKIFEDVTEPGDDAQSQVIAVTSFLQEWFFHPLFPPVDADGISIYDPVWLLENRIGQCGQVNRLAADILSVAGFKTRLVQLNGHQAAEVWYDGAWHYVDADAIDFGTMIYNRDGIIASVEEIAADLSLLDGIVAYAETRSYSVEVLQKPFDLRDAFVPTEYNGMITPFVYEKVASDLHEQNKYFGWTSYQVLEMK